MCIHISTYVMIQMKQAHYKEYEHTENFCIREVIKTQKHS